MREVYRVNLETATLLDAARTQRGRDELLRLANLLRELVEAETEDARQEIGGALALALYEIERAAR